MKSYYIIVTPFFPSPDSFRGPFIYDQAKAISKFDKYDVVVFKPSFNKHDRGYEYCGVKVLNYYVRETPSYLFNGIFNNYNSKNFLNSLTQNNIEIANIAVIHCHTSSFGACGLEAKKINPNIKVLLQHHDKDPYCVLNGKFAGWRINARYRAKKNIKIFNEVDCHICISEAVKNNLTAFPNADKKETYKPYLDRVSLMGGLPSITPKKIEILYNGVDKNKFFQQPKFKSEIFTIGCIGNFLSLKAHRDLIMAVAKWKKRDYTVNFRLVMVGSGPELNYCKDLSKALNLADNVEFLTEVDHNELCNLYNRFHLFVLPTHFDGFGCVCTEAYACGVPYIITENQGAAEYIRTDETSLWTYKPGDVERLSDMIENFYKHRYVQTLIHPIDINILMADFFKRIGL